jgi:hypothetical protein
MCVAGQQDFIETKAVKFQQTLAITRAHLQSPRFGHSNNLTQLFSKSRAQQKDYVVGLFAGSIALFVFFAVWLAILIAFKCLGYKRVGLFSGSTIMIPGRPKPCEGSKLDIVSTDVKPRGAVGVHVSDTVQDDCPIKSVKLLAGMGWSAHDEETYKLEPHLGSNAAADQAEKLAEPTVGTSITEGHVDGESVIDQRYEKELSTWNQEVYIRDGRIKQLRIAVLTCGLVIIVCEMLMQTKGLPLAAGALIDARQAIQKADNLARSAIVILDQYAQLWKPQCSY